MQEKNRVFLLYHVLGEIDFCMPSRSAISKFKIDLSRKRFECACITASAISETFSSLPIRLKVALIGLQVFINGVPDLKLIPKEKWDSFITALELQISDYTHTP